MKVTKTIMLGDFDLQDHTTISNIIDFYLVEEGIEISKLDSYAYHIEVEVTGDFKKEGEGL
tara:strand:- start:955 stop:1137 length:183 start_codon:yes stop_codon:yes gene_type:complete